MNILEAFEELDALNEANLAQQFNGLFNFDGKCLGCGAEFATTEECISHMLGCDEARELLSHRDAVIKVGKSGHSIDAFNNISVLAFMKYISEQTTCELCKKPIAEIKDRRPDHKNLGKVEHKHIKDVGIGSFRGVLCNSCNTLLGKIEKLDAGDIKGVDKIKTYLDGAETKIANYKV